MQTNKGSAQDGNGFLSDSPCEVVPENTAWRLDGASLAATIHCPQWHSIHPNLRCGPSSLLRWNADCLKGPCLKEENVERAKR